VDGQLHPAVREVTVTPGFDVFLIFTIETQPSGVPKSLTTKRFELPVVVTVTSGALTRKWGFDFSTLVDENELMLLDTPRASVALAVQASIVLC
jgi:hypothetical protein